MPTRFPYYSDFKNKLAARRQEQQERLEEATGDHHHHHHHKNGVKALKWVVVIGGAILIGCMIAYIYNYYASLTTDGNIVNIDTTSADTTNSNNNTTNPIKNLQWSVFTFNSISGNFTNSSNAAGYIIKFRKGTDAFDSAVPGDNLTLVSGSTSTTFTISKLIPNMSYDVQVIAIGSGGLANSNAITSSTSAKTLPMPVTNPPTNLTFGDTVTQTKISGQFTTSSNADGYSIFFKKTTDPVSAFTQAIEGSNLTTFNNSNTQVMFILSGLSSAISYDCQVVALGMPEIPNSIPTTIVSATTLAAAVAPSSLALDKIEYTPSGSLGTTILTWTPGSTTPNIVNYRIDGKMTAPLSSVTTNFYPMFTDLLPHNVVSVEVDGLIPATTYQFRVTGIDADGNEVYSPVQELKLLPADLLFYYTFEDQTNTNIVGNQVKDTVTTAANITYPSSAINAAPFSGTYSRYVGLFSATPGSKLDVALAGTNPTSGLTITNNYQLPASHTKSIWVANTSGAQAVGHIFSGSGNTFSTMYFDSNGYMTVEAPAGSNQIKDTTKQFTAASSEWNHFALVVDSTSSTKTVTLYRNGMKVGNNGASLTQAPAFTGSTTGTNEIGAYSGGNFFTGSITNVALYNRALTPNEIQYLASQAS